MKSLSKLGAALTCALAVLTFSAQFSSASARLLACVCDGGTGCRLQKGREQVNYAYDPKNMGAAYDAIEQNAMQQADAQAVAKASATMAGDNNLRCAPPCDAAPGLSIIHGPPFAGGMNGNGMARSLWEVRYVCKKTPPPPPAPKFSPYNPGPGGGGYIEPPRGGEGLPKSDVKLPQIPKCFGLGADKDELLEELHRMREQQTHDIGPLGVDRDAPEFIEWKARVNANIEAIDAAIKQAEATPLCDPTHKHSGLFDHVQIGIGIGVGHESDDHRDDRHHDRRDEDRQRPVDTDSPFQDRR